MPSKTPLFTPVLIVGCVILIVSFAVRATFGVFQIPIAEEFGWLRAEFSMAIAIQNLAWGIGQPLFGALAEKIGDRKSIVIGSLVYAVGLLLTAGSTTPFEHQAYAWLVGFGVAGTGFGVILAVVGRASSDENRSMSLAIVSAAGSAGQIFGPPLAEWMLGFMPWQSIFVVFAVSIVSVLLVLPFMRSPSIASKTELEESLGEILGKAFRDPSFTFLYLGFFSCGYQLGFITAHLPAFVTELCGPIMPGGMLDTMGISTTSALGALSIALIGVTNIMGTLAAGWAGKRYPKKYLLAGIYTARTVVGALFIMMPITPTSVILFALAMGALWLATVPLTSGLVAHIYGLRYMGTLYGLVFLSHQIGGFTGIWLGGRLYDVYGDYTLVWWIGLAVGAFSAVIHLPIRERRLEGLRTA